MIKTSGQISRRYQQNKLDYHHKTKKCLMLGKIILLQREVLLLEHSIGIITCFFAFSKTNCLTIYIICWNIIYSYFSVYGKKWKAATITYTSWMNYDRVVGATVGSDGQVRLDIWIILDNAQSSLKKKHLSHESSIHHHMLLFPSQICSTTPVYGCTPINIAF